MLDGMCLSFVLQQQLGVYNPSSHSFDNHFDTRINLAAGAIHTPDPPSVNETETISDADQINGTNLNRRRRSQQRSCQ